MPQSPRLLAKINTGILLAAMVLALAACGGPRQPDELARAVAVGERPVAMSGTASFFNGTVGVTVTISRGIGRGTAAAAHGGANARVIDTFGMDKDEAQAYADSKNAVGSPLPPVTIHLKLASLQKSTAVIEVVDCVSDLGNFAVHPEILALAPDQTSEPDTMISQLGVDSDEIPMKVSLRLGGKLETQTVLVKSVAVPPAAQ